MQCYKSYKPSGIQWVEKVPSHWGVERAKWLFNRMERPVRPEDDVVTAFRDGQVTLRTNRRTEGFTNALQEHGYQGIRKGDLVIHAMDAFAGAIGVSDSDGKSTPVYAACVPRGEYPVNSYYYAYLLRYMAHSGYIESLSKGIRERSTDFRFAEFRELPLPIPDKDEQDRIVTFLDQKTAEIEAAIGKKERLVEALREQRVILITEAVTRGLNANVTMQDTGMERLGKVPAHWPIVRFKRCFSIIKDGLHHTPEKHDEGVSFISTQHVRNRQINTENATKISVKDYALGHPRTRPEAGDVLITLVGSIGFAAIVRTEHLPFSCTRHVGYVRPIKSKINSDFLLYYTESAAFAAFIDKNISRTAQPSIYLSSISNHEITLPSLTEQRQIVDWLDQRVGAYDQIFDRINKQISQMESMKLSLIANVVTGRIKV